MAWKKKPRFKAPEGEFERLTQENSIEVAFDAQATLPLDIGIELPDGRMQPIVKRGTKIPFRRSEMYSTAAAYQTSVEMHFLLGNRPLAKDNMTIGRVRLRDIRWSNQGLPMIDALVGMDDGVLFVGSNNLDRTTDKGAVSEAREHIAKRDIEALSADAKAHEDADARWRAYIEESDSGRILISETADIYAAAKKKMTFAQKRSHNKIVNRLCKTLNSPIGKLDDEAIDRFRADMATLKDSLPRLKSLQAQVMGWYR